MLYNIFQQNFYIYKKKKAYDGENYSSNQGVH